MQGPPKPKPFPSFEDGDVEIRLSTSVEHTYRVHSLVLGLHSPFFKASLSKRWAGDPEAASSSDPVLWRYELRFKDGQAEGICIRKVQAANYPSSRDMLNLEQLQDPSEPNPVSAVEDSDGVGPPSLIGYDDTPMTALAEARRKCIDAHIHLFGLVYHKPLALPKANFNEAKGPLESIMTVADMYGCSSLAATHMENHLSNFKANVDVLTQCYMNISEMLDFSTKLRSAWLFKETMVHAVNDPRSPNDISENSDVSIIIVLKRTDLLQKMADVDQQLLFHVGYPKGGEENLVHILARAYFRDWLTRKLKKQGLSLRPGYAKVYRRIYRRKVPSIKKFQAYLEKAGRPENVSLPAFCGAVLDCFAQALPLVHRLVSCSSTVRQAILARSCGMLNVPLTCTDVPEDEMPWKHREW